MKNPSSRLTEADAERVVKSVLDQLTERVYFVGANQHVTELNFQAVLAELSDNPQFREAWLLLGQAAFGG
jgi:hypothetical protein